VFDAIGVFDRWKTDVQHSDGVKTLNEDVVESLTVECGWEIEQFQR
jgi:hypothetical protein